MNSCFCDPGTNNYIARRQPMGIRAYIVYKYVCVCVTIMAFIIHLLRQQCVFAPRTMMIRMCADGVSVSISVKALGELK